MERYKNFGGDSDITGYEIRSDSIAVKFRNNSVYIYSYQSAGRINVERMKTLAISGHGLNSFIMRYVKYKYIR